MAITNALETTGVGHHHQLQGPGAHHFGVPNRVDKCGGIPRRTAIHPRHGHSERGHAVDKINRVRIVRRAANRYLCDHWRHARARLDQVDQQFQLRQRNKRLQ